MTAAALDVLIVGGGPAGLSTWLHLHELAPAVAARTLLIERASYPRDKVCGGGVTAQGDFVLKCLGVRTDVPAVPIHNIEFRVGTRSYFLRRPNIFRVVRRREFDHALATAAVARGLCLHEGEALVDFEPDADGLIVRTTRATYRVGTLVGADGAYSAVRRRMGLDEGTCRARLLETTIPARAQDDALFTTHTAVFDFTPVSCGLQGYVWDFPCLDNGASAINRGIFDSRIFPERPRPNLKAVFSGALAEREVPVHPRTWAGHPVRWFAETSVVAQPRVLLVGDAAGVDPSLGEGISLALEYGELAADTLRDAFQCNDFSFTDYHTRLLQHPLGRSLRMRTSVAKRMYRDGPAALEALGAAFAQDLSPC